MGSCYSGHTNQHSTRSPRDEPEDTEEEGQVIPAKVPGQENLREAEGPEAGTENGKMPWRGHRPAGSGQPETERVSRERVGSRVGW